MPEHEGKRDCPDATPECGGDNSRNRERGPRHQIEWEWRYTQSVKQAQYALMKDQDCHEPGKKRQSDRGSKLWS